MPWSLSVNALLNNLNYFLSDLVIREGQIQALLMISVMVVVIMFFKNLTRYLGMYYIIPIRNGVVRDVRSLLYNKILALPIGYFTDERKGDLISRMTSDVQEIEYGIMNSLEAAFREPLNIIIFLITMFTMSVHLTVIVLIYYR